MCKSPCRKRWKSVFAGEPDGEKNAVFTGLLRIGHIIKKEKNRRCKRKRESKKKSK